MAKIIPFPATERRRTLEEQRAAEVANAAKACKEAGEPRVSRSGRRYRYAASKTPAGALVWKHGYATQQEHNPVQLELDLQNCTGRTPARRERERYVVLADLESRGQRVIDTERDHPKHRWSHTVDFYYFSMGGEILCTTLRGLTDAECAYLQDRSLDSWGNRRDAGWASRDANIRHVVWPSESTAPIIRIDHEE